MCVLLLSIGIHPAFKLILLSNRDEYYLRSSSPAAFWEDHPGVLGGRDLKGGGTWLGITREGRIGALTNYRDPINQKDNAPSRGGLVRRYLCARQGPREFIQDLRPEANAYNGFNLIIGDMDRLYCYSNRDSGIRELTPGVYGISNHLLDTPWPKVVKGKAALTRLLAEGQDPDRKSLFEILHDRSMPDDALLPATGVGLDWERILSPIFVQSPTYGTRASTLLLIDKEDRVCFIEKTHGPGVEDRSNREYEFFICSQNGLHG